MKRAIVLSLASALGAGGAAALAADGTPPASDEAGSIYFSPMLQYGLNNNSRLSDNFGYQAGIGFNLPKEWAIEGDFSRGTYDIKGTDDATRRLTGYSLDVIKKFFPPEIMERWMLQPYALAGGGEMDVRTNAPGYDGSTYHTFLAEAGVGLLTGIGSQTGSTRVQLRTEAKYRVAWANPSMFGVKDPSGLIFGVGVQMNFGEHNDTPPVIREVVREVPAPTPPPPPPPPPPPAAPPAPPPPKGEIRLQGVTFATDSSELNPESDGVLNTTIASLKQYPQLVIEVRGYTDSRGTAEYNLKLSQRRAESVMRYLQEHGLSNQLSAKGYGKADPIADNSTKDGQLANRRVTLHIESGS